MSKEKLTIVRLSGALGKQFGKVHRFYISSPGEAVRALCVNCKGFERFMRDPARKILYKVFANDRQIDPENELHITSTLHEVRIAPMIQGAKSGAFQVLLGAALIAMAFVPGLGVAAATGAFTTFGSLALPMGISLALSGVASLISSQPALNLDTGDGQANKPNSGLTPTNRNLVSGTPIPLAFGRVMLPGTAISASIIASDTAG